MPAPCTDWPIVPACADWDTQTAELKAEATAWATQILWALSGRRFGTCPVTVRPCNQCGEQSWQTYGVLWDSGSNGGWVPYMRDGVWRNCHCAGVHTCEPASQVYLPGPVAQVTEVKVDGVVVPPAAYRVDDGVWLVRQDGGEWPQYQDLGLAAGLAGTFTVTYERGIAPPKGAEIAAGALACEYVKLRNGGDCALSQQIQSVTRQGVSFEVLPVESNDGLTGVAQADMWLKAVNPHHLRQRPRVSSPDMPEPRVTTWGA